MHHTHHSQEKNPSHLCDISPPDANNREIHTFNLLFFEANEQYKKNSTALPASHHAYSRH